VDTERDWPSEAQSLRGLWERPTDTAGNQTN